MSLDKLVENVLLRYTPGVNPKTFALHGISRNLSPLTVTTNLTLDSEEANDPLVLSAVVSVKGYKFPVSLQKTKSLVVVTIVQNSGLVRLAHAPPEEVLPPTSRGTPTGKTRVLTEPSNTTTKTETPRLLLSSTGRSRASTTVSVSSMIWSQIVGVSNTGPFRESRLCFQ